jgi:hypothetical protein
MHFNAILSYICSRSWSFPIKIIFLPICCCVHFVNSAIRAYIQPVFPVIQLKLKVLVEY